MKIKLFLIILLLLSGCMFNPKIGYYDTNVNRLSAFDHPPENESNGIVYREILIPANYSSNLFVTMSGSAEKKVIIRLRNIHGDILWRKMIPDNVSVCDKFAVSDDCSYLFYSDNEKETIMKLDTLEIQHFKNDGSFRISVGD